jgi:hypothetical protein
VGKVKADVAAGSVADIQVFLALLSQLGAKSFLFLFVFHKLTHIFHAYCGTHRYSAVPCKLKFTAVTCYEGTEGVQRYCFALFYNLGAG